MKKRTAGVILVLAMCSRPSSAQWFISGEAGVSRINTRIVLDAPDFHFSCRSEGVLCVDMDAGSSWDWNHRHVYDRLEGDVSANFIFGAHRRISVSPRAGLTGATINDHTDLGTVPNLGLAIRRRTFLGNAIRVDAEYRRFPGQRWLTITAGLERAR
jgi:hypothetical protein